MRPDRILLQELRDGAAFFYLRNVNTGHPGSITTVHADSRGAGLRAADPAGQGKRGRPRPRPRRHPRPAAPPGRRGRPVPGRPGRLCGDGDRLRSRPQACRSPRRRRHPQRSRLSAAASAAPARTPNKLSVLAAIAGPVIGWGTAVGLTETVPKAHAIGPLVRLMAGDAGQAGAACRRRPRSRRRAGRRLVHQPAAGRDLRRRRVQAPPPRHRRRLGRRAGPPHHRARRQTDHHRRHSAAPRGGNLQRADGRRHRLRQIHPDQRDGAGGAEARRQEAHRPRSGRRHALEVLLQGRRDPQPL